MASFLFYFHMFAFTLPITHTLACFTAISLLALADALPPSSRWCFSSGGCLAALVALVGWIFCHL
jgi:hypothetical protein